MEYDFHDYFYSNVRQVHTLMVLNESKLQEYMRPEMHGMDLEVKADSVCQEAMEQYEPKTMLCTKGRAPKYDSACNVSLINCALGAPLPLHNSTK